MNKETHKFIELALAKIQSDLEHMAVQFNRIEDFTYSLSKKTNEMEKSLSFIKGGFYVFITTFAIASAITFFK
tara:strand:+ start:281 stop:499 length:219 start_codon:yes stop_codon:yes gene_type:complete